MSAFTHYLAPCRAVLLDMDGTLVNSDDAVEAAWAAWARANGVEAADVLAVCHGSDVATTVRRFLPGIGEAELAEHVAAHLERECADTDGVRSAPGAPELIAWMDGRSLPWAVVTNAHPRLARARPGAVRGPDCQTDRTSAWARESKCSSMSLRAPRDKETVSTSPSAIPRRAIASSAGSPGGSRSPVTPS